MNAKTLDSKKEAYKLWAPDDAAWTQWAKPVLFASVPVGELFLNVQPLDKPQVSWLPEKCFYTMIIVDLPGKQGVEEGLSLARSGYRPVPLYNGVLAQGANAIVQNFDTAAALYAGADVLGALRLAPSAPPCFLLDYYRMFGRGKQPGTFDNRWSVFPQDMPSAAFLATRHIREVIVRSIDIQDDLAVILRRYQEQGVKISLCKGSEIEPVTIPKPSRFKSLFYRFRVILGLTRNAAGGFGGLVPVPQSSGGGG